MKSVGIRIPAGVYDQLKMGSKDSYRSINQEIIYVLTEYYLSKGIDKQLLLDIPVKSKKGES
jgi:hypothetical protein